MAEITEGHSPIDHLRLEASLIGTQLAETVNQRSDANGRTDMSMLQGLPLTIRIELKNTSTDERIEVPDIDLEMDHVVFMLISPDNRTFPITVHAWAQAGDHMPAIRTLSPGESIVWETFLFGQLEPAHFNGNTQLVHRYLFPKPGRYRLHARLTLERPIKLDMMSDELSLRIEQPDDVWDALVESDVVATVERLRAGVSIPRADIDKALRALESADATVRSSQYLHAFDAWLRTRRDQ
ncbi:MAG: hypothetical protein EA376_04320 [Phycisphaeraceae bacterium]|nr:MAG: hypothetical protein EA376_04320 [Phycisphaeraceae bacterium]